MHDARQIAYHPHYLFINFACQIFIPKRLIKFVDLDGRAILNSPCPLKNEPGRRLQYYIKGIAPEKINIFEETAHLYH